MMMIVTGTHSVTGTHADRCIDRQVMIVTGTQIVIGTHADRCIDRQHIL